MISGLKVKRNKKGEIVALVAPGRAPYGRTTRPVVAASLTPNFRT